MKPLELNKESKVNSFKLINAHNYWYTECSNIPNYLDASQGGIVEVVLKSEADKMPEALCSIYYMANLETLLKTKYSVPTVQMIMQQMADAIASARGR